MKDEKDEWKSGVVGLHLNMMGLRPGIDLRTTELSAAEKAWLAKVRGERDEKTAYQRIQATRPQTLGVALTDLPVGLAAWIVEKFQAWSDCGGDPLKRFSMDLLLDNIMVYWLTGTAGTATWLYRGVTEQQAARLPDGKRVETPTAFAAFPADLARRRPRNGSSAPSTCAATPHAQGRAFRGPGGARPAGRGHPRLLPAAAIRGGQRLVLPKYLRTEVYRTISRPCPIPPLPPSCGSCARSPSSKREIDPGLGAVHGLALREFMFLVQLDQAPANRLRRVDLAACLNVSQSTVTRLALPLEKLGFVKREADPRDARVGYVVLTKAGRQRVAEARATLERSAAGIFRDRWSDKEIATLASLLGRFTAALPGDVT